MIATSTATSSKFATKALKRIAAATMSLVLAITLTPHANAYAATAAADGASVLATQDVATKAAASVATQKTSARKDISDNEGSDFTWTKGTTQKSVHVGSIITPVRFRVSFAGGYDWDSYCGHSSIGSHPQFCAYSNYEIEDVKWKSSNPKALSINQNGVSTLRKYGKWVTLTATAKIRVTDENTSKSTEIVLSASFKLTCGSLKCRDAIWHYDDSKRFLTVKKSDVAKHNVTVKLGGVIPEAGKVQWVAVKPNSIDPKQKWVSEGYLGGYYEKNVKVNCKKGTLTILKGTKLINKYAKEDGYYMKLKAYVPYAKKNGQDYFPTTKTTDFVVRLV